MNKKHVISAIGVAAIVILAQGTAMAGGPPFWGIPPWNPPQPNTPVKPIPEAPTVIAGALLALPFGLCALRSLRKPRD